MVAPRRPRREGEGEAGRGSGASPLIRIFAQAAPGAIDLAGIVRQGTRLFSVSVEVVSVAGSRAHLSVTTRDGVHAYRLTSRATTDGDVAEARAAEARGLAAGMASLAARCAAVWELEATSSAAVEATRDAATCAQLELCAVLASVALGPVLPPSGDTLFGVRGALERASRARA